MAKNHDNQTSQEVVSQLRVIAEQAFSRAAGTPLVSGNSVRLLKNAQENYPAWLEAIKSAEHSIHFESYIIHDDEMGREFAEVLAAQALRGVRVKVIYDWVGAVGTASFRLWRPLRAAGVEVRCFNPLRLDSPFGWLSRDHRKMIAVDGRVGFVTGLCVGKCWVGDAACGVEPWRDTGVEVRGPAVADIEQAFAETWAVAGAPLPPDELCDRATIPASGKTSLRVVASVPNTAGLYRLDQLIAAMARRSLWLTDAYFVGTTPYVQALRAAAKDGVDVRLLVPNASDVPLVRALSRSGYRPLLEGGIRVFEWNGPMIHAKTAVADGRWARVGSSNLNLTSWVGNWELDVVVEDQTFGQAMEQMYLEDLTHATEIVLSAKRKPRPTARPKRRHLRPRIGAGSSGRVAAGAIRLSHTVGAAITNHRVLGPSEARIMGSAGLFLLALAIVGVFWPRSLSLPIAVFGVWVAISLFIRAYKLHREGKREREASQVTPMESETTSYAESEQHVKNREIHGIR